MILHNTEISIPGGSTKMSTIISEFTLDEKTIVTGFNIKRRKNVDCEVASTRKSSTKDLLYIGVSTDEHLLITPDHKIYIPEEKGYIRADKLIKGMELQHVLAEPCEVIDIHMIRNNDLQTTHALTVTDCENYFSNSILVHNCGAS
jgi:hypothetical protein